MAQIREPIGVTTLARSIRQQSSTVACLVLIVVLAGAPSAIQAEPAATIEVNTLTDEFGSGSDCSLREAIQAANTDAAYGGCPAGSGDDIIDLAEGTYTLERPDVNEDANETGDLDIHGNLTLNGAGQARTVIDGDGLDRVLHIFDYTVEINDLTITGGHAPDGLPGAAFFVPGANGTSGGEGALGGGIYNLGTLTMIRCRISGNRAGDGGAASDGQAGADGDDPGEAGGVGGDGGFGGHGGSGGGILNEGTLTLRSCLVDDNRAGAGGLGGNGGPGGHGANGGAASKNGGAGGAGGRGWDGGEGGDGGGIRSSGPVLLYDSILRDNAGGDSGAAGQGAVGGNGGNGYGTQWAGSGGAGGAGGEGGRGNEGGEGGAIYIYEPLTVQRCAITQNRSGNGSPGGTGGSGGQGGNGGHSVGGLGGSAGPGGPGGQGGEGGQGGSSGYGGGMSATGGIMLILGEVKLNHTGDGAPGASGGQGGAGGIGGDRPLGSGASGGSGGDGGDGGHGGYGGDGGGINGYGSADFALTFLDSVVSSNATGAGSDGGAGGQGGDAGRAGKPIGAPGLNGNGGDGGGGAEGGEGGGLKLGSGGLPATLDGCTVSGNTTGDGGSGGHGGDSGAAVANSTGTGGDGESGGSGGDGGGLSAFNMRWDLVNSTISGNSAGNGGDGGDGGEGQAAHGQGDYGARAGSGGGIFSMAVGSAYNCTIAANRALGSGGAAGGGALPGDDGEGGGIVNRQDFSLAHTLLGDNSSSGTGPDCIGTVDSQDYNLIESVSGCTVNGTTEHNITGLDPRLQALANNTGPTETHMLGSDSPALDGGASTCYESGDEPLTVDQRGKPRAADGNHDGEVLCDIGALEVQEREHLFFLPIVLGR